jgi:hypothetical protein
VKAEAVQPYLPTLESNIDEHSRQKVRLNGSINRLDSEDTAIHDWYRFVLSFPPHLVRKYVRDFGLSAGDTILDPFCGTGTTLVEAKLNGFQGVGFESNPVTHFASSVKTSWEIDADAFLADSTHIAAQVLEILAGQGIDDEQSTIQEESRTSLKTLPPETAKLLIKDSISPLPLHKTLVLLDVLRNHSREPYYRHALLALATALVRTIGNLRFGPEVGVGEIKSDIPVIAAWLTEITRIASDLTLVAGNTYRPASVYYHDSRDVHQVLKPHSVDAVITSPPYPNEKDYSRSTRLESVILGFVNSRGELRSLKKNLLRSNTRGVYKSDDDDQWILDNPDIQRLAASIESRRIALGKTSGFERLYSRVTQLYFGGMARHLANLRHVLRPGARLAYVVGDQASYLQVLIRTGELLCDLAETLGYEVIGTDLFRTRFATATKEQLREEVIILSWPGV